MFWNVAGLGKKDKEFWEGLKEWDVLFLSETWTEERNWRGIRERLPEGYVWETQWALRRNRKGRAMGGMIMRIRKEWVEGGESIERKGEVVLGRRVRIGKEKWRIIGVYVGGNEMEGKLWILEEWMSEDEKDIKTIMGGDFNARTGKEGGRIEDEEEWKGERKGKRNSKVN